MLGYFIYLILGAVMLVYWLIAAYLPEIKAFVKRMLHGSDEAASHR